MKRLFAVLLLCMCALPVTAEVEMMQIPRAQMEALAKEHAEALKLLDAQDKVIDEQLHRIRQLQAATNCV